MLCFILALKRGNLFLRITNSLLKLPQKIQFAALEMPHVFDAVLHHYQAVNAAANQLNPAFTAAYLTAGVFAFAEGAA